MLDRVFVRLFIQVIILLYYLIDLVSFCGGVGDRLGWFCCVSGTAARRQQQQGSFAGEGWCWWLWVGCAGAAYGGVVGPFSGVATGACSPGSRDGGGSGPSHSRWPRLVVGRVAV